jgi:hypothetical protein
MSAEELVQQMANYRDKFKVITQKNKDGGDTLNRTAHYYSALSILNLRDDNNKSSSIGLMFEDIKITRSLDLGRYCRHPDTSAWYSNPDNVTRDQMAPMECAMALTENTPFLKQHLKLRLKRGLLHFSTQDQIEGQPGKVKYKLPDLPSPLELAVMIRGLNLKIFYPLLFLLDLFLLHEAKSVNADTIREGQLLLHLAVGLKHLTTPPVTKAVEALEPKIEDLRIGLRDYYSEDEGRNGIRPLGELMVLVLNSL